MTSDNIPVKQLVVSFVGDSVDDHALLDLVDRQTEGTDMATPMLVIFRTYDDKVTSNPELAHRISTIRYNDADPPAQSTMPFTQIHGIDFDKESIIVARNVKAIENGLSAFVRDAAFVRTCTHDFSNAFFFMNEMCMSDLDVEMLMQDHHGWSAVCMAISNAFDL